MISKQLRLGIDNLGPPFLKRLCNACVQCLSWSTQQRTVGRIAHQRMLEDEDRARQRPSAKYKSGISQPRKRACNLCLVVLRNDDQQFVGELPPDCRRELSD